MGDGVGRQLDEDIGQLEAQGRDRQVERWQALADPPGRIDMCAVAGTELPDMDTRPVARDHAAHVGAKLDHPDATSV